MADPFTDQALAELREATVAVFWSELELVDAIARARVAGATDEQVRGALVRILGARSKAIDEITRLLGWGAQ